MENKVAIGCDHGGIELKLELIEHLKSLGKTPIDVGCHKEDGSVDYPDYARAICKEVTAGNCKCGIAVCGSGIGISIAANKVSGIRCALLHDHYGAHMCRQHNNANVMALGGRVTGVEVAKEIVTTFLQTEFEGGRHQRRVDKIEQ
ncbi:Sugar-phosphate isomerase, RpiB/LacA/LacB family [Carpediemonas membranifera]|uniref:Sugar-phosphate isomerase, RpiB/LacA/LacB family n=1 Tax=Carpediemonas membranifera TaxID=201153 RepID=A0A8J6E4K6_9EUKA|nr:Sugar-phosphate isomerase, RpiB/LacA/LacB family [Carpediemonas membranifera]|eukprot:KAG9394597.1 Sugar-phosphate isomerase, RpiB/LacA/LacB family [Carpediemonas membranifera]